MNEPDVTSENRQSLWWIAASPLVWAGHFLVSYITAAVWCEKAGAPDASLAPVRVTIAVATVLALGAIAAVGYMGYRSHRFGGGTPPHDWDTPEDRHRFLGWATLLLSALSAVATVFVAIAAAYFFTCH